MNYHWIAYGIMMAAFLLLFLRSFLALRSQPRQGSRVGFLGVCIALAVTLGLVESFIPDFIVPGVKIGFPNIVVLFLLCYVSKGEALAVSLLRVALVGILRGNLFQMGGLMSLSGALISFAIMVCLKVLFKKLSPIFLSCVGALFHGLGQLLVGVGFLGTWSIFYYYPLMGFLSILAGVFSGMLAMILRKRLQPLMETRLMKPLS